MLVLKKWICYIKKTSAGWYSTMTSEVKNEQLKNRTHLRFSILILGALQDMMNYSASGRVWEECFSIADSETKR